MYRDYDPKSSYSRANRSTKWDKVLRLIWEEFQQKELYTVVAMKNILVDCIHRKMDAASIFEELVPECISDHVLC